MVSLNNGKHNTGTVENTRCSIAESGCTAARAQFLKELLELNKYEVKVEEEKKKNEGDATTFTVGVTDVLFHPVIDIYERRLKTKTGKKVTPAYWLQLSDHETEAEVNYWTFKN
jgi:hypothetical protein